MNRPVVIYVDVDDTLIRSVGTKRIPIPNVVRHVRRLKEDGAVLVCWSTGGGEYARQCAEELDISDCFSAFLPKPNILIDDQPMRDWKRLIHVSPLQVHNQDLTEYLSKLDSSI
jgi:hypothetical protein